jgi:hypothetical protein
MTVLANRSGPDPALLAGTLSGYAQPAEQRLPTDFLAMLVQINRSEARGGGSWRQVQYPIAGRDAYPADFA